MRLLVNSLSIGSLSGRHVLFGHVEQLARHADSSQEILLLHLPSEDVSRLTAFPAVKTLTAPVGCGSWIRRTVWEAITLPKLMRKEKVDAYFSPSGTILPGSPVPQATLAQNPWCMVPGMQRTLAEKLKAAVQRRAYRRAFCHADLMIYNSQHMRDLYQRNAPGLQEKRQLIVYQGIDEETFGSAIKNRSLWERTPLTILAVSVMAHWKGIDVLIKALSQLHTRGVPARAVLVGPWADPAYKQLIEQQIQELHLQSYVDIAGHVSKERLHQHYAQARVFCLMSRCESFGIPAVEAQAFGTPVVGSSICAMQEICGAGGHCTHPDHVDEVTGYLEQLLTDDAHWQLMSRRALENAERFHWADCSQPLQILFQLPSLSSSTLANAHSV